MSFYKEVPGRQTTLESTLKFDTTPTEGSANPVTSDGVKSAIDGAVEDASEALQEQIDDIAEKAGSGYIPKGEATVATLNGLSGQENGELYTMTDAGTLTDGSLAVVAGDTVAWDEANSVWYKAMDYAPRQYGTNEVHNLPTTITAFRTGDVIPVDGPNGTAKFLAENLVHKDSATISDCDAVYVNGVYHIDTDCANVPTTFTNNGSLAVLAYNNGRCLQILQQNGIVNGGDPRTSSQTFGKVWIRVRKGTDAWTNWESIGTSTEISAEVNSSVNSWITLTSYPGRYCCS